jgi:Cyclic-phosphate processing Receiver domain
VQVTQISLLPGPVFILEDDLQRLAWFRQRIPHAVVAKTSDHALEILKNHRFDTVFLDHDLSEIDAYNPNRLHGNGKEVARFLAWSKFPGRVIIHSVNELGAAVMKSYLKTATVLPFGSFEITRQ